MDGIKIGRKGKKAKNPQYFSGLLFFDCWDLRVNSFLVVRVPLRSGTGVGVRDLDYPSETRLCHWKFYRERNDLTIVKGMT